MDVKDGIGQLFMRVNELSPEWQFKQFSCSSVMLIDSLGIAVKHIGKLLTYDLGNFNCIFVREY